MIMFHPAMEDSELFSLPEVGGHGDSQESRPLGCVGAIRAAIDEAVLIADWHDAGLRKSRLQVPGMPQRRTGRVTGLVSEEQALAATRTVEAQTGAQISPAYQSLQRVTVEDRSFKTMAAVPNKLTVQIGDLVELNSRYRDPDFACHFIPWTTPRRSRTIVRSRRRGVALRPQLARREPCDLRYGKNGRPMAEMGQRTKPLARLRARRWHLADEADATAREGSVLCEDRSSQRHDESISSPVTIAEKTSCSIA
jgi:hypothetical protein